MIIRGTLHAESPIYRGNMRKTLFTRDGDGTHRLVSLAGEISGTAQTLMDAFIGQSRDGRNIGLLDRLWRRMYGRPMPRELVTKVRCTLQKESYTSESFFDLRMGLRLDEDRWAAETNANYKMETVLRNSVFDLVITVDDSVLATGDNASRLYYLLKELEAGRFWFGGGKSRGLGRLRLEAEIPFTPDNVPDMNPAANHLTIVLAFDARNPLLVGWNWGKFDPDAPHFAAIEGRALVEAMRDIPSAIRERLAMVLGGPILSPEDWKTRFADLLPRVIAVWLQERSATRQELWTLPRRAVAKLSKGKYALSKKVLKSIEPLIDRPFHGREEAEATLVAALGTKANMAKRILKLMVHEEHGGYQLDRKAWQEICESLGLDPALERSLAERIDDEESLTKLLAEACRPALKRLEQQADQHINLLRSDSWIDAEIATREQHILIKTMLLEGKITEEQWLDPASPPPGIKAAAWREFVDAHRRVRFTHMLNARNLRKSITNDRNMIAFLQFYRERTRQELVQPYNVDFRAGGPYGRTISRKYGKPYDTIFTRMLSWGPSREEGSWEIYIPGSTIKGAFRKRASQVLKTLWGESPQATQLLDRLFGAHSRRGLVFFSDAYLTAPLDPERAWCSMDGVRMDPATGHPTEEAKFDCLFAYGPQLAFRCRLDLQDINERDTESMLLLAHLLEDLARGDIPLGGLKTSGLGWVTARVVKLTWLTADPDGLGKELFPEHKPERDGVWHVVHLEGEKAHRAMVGMAKDIAVRKKQHTTPPRAPSGFVSHRSFGGYCGLLSVEAQVLTPLHIRESGHPSYVAQVDGGRVNGWDFFSMSPPDPQVRPQTKTYALPSRSIKGLLRHIYTIASDSSEPSTSLDRLNPVDSLFGWVGHGPNQALMGRVAIGFALFPTGADAPPMAWFKVPYPYGEWRYLDGQWRQVKGARGILSLRVGGRWRVFTHAPPAPIVRQIDDFTPDAFQATYLRAILPGARARFTIRFWNLDEEEMSRLMWCIVLEPNLAHKMGKHRYLGMGSVRFHLLPDSFFIDWRKRYSGSEWQVPIDVNEWLRPDTISHYEELQRALNAERI